MRKANEIEVFCHKLEILSHKKNKLGDIFQAQNVYLIHFSHQAYFKQLKVMGVGGGCKFVQLDNNKDDNIHK